MEKEAEYRLCNIAIWIFFFLLIFEGAFRKWILPSLSDVFLIIRDPLAIFVVFMACKHCGLARNKFVITAWAIALITTITALLFGHQNLFIALYGARIWVYYIPLIFAIPHFLLAKDVVLMFKSTLPVTVGMAVLLCLQYFTPQTSIFNIGVGGAGASGFAGVGKYFRPSGTFSFTEGVALFMMWAGCCLIIYYIINSKYKNLKLHASVITLLAATTGFIVCIPVSLSRAVVTEAAVLLIWAIIVLALNRQIKKDFLKIGVALIIIIPPLMQSGIMRTATSNMQMRFESAANAEGDFIRESIVDRGIKYVFAELLDNENIPFFYGSGIGMSTNVAATLLTGKKDFLTREGGSDLIENGYLVGSIMFLTKWAILIYILAKCYKARKSSIVPLLFCIFCIIARPGTGQTPTAVGFNNFGAAIALTLALRSETDIIRKEETE